MSINKRAERLEVRESDRILQTGSTHVRCHILHGSDQIDFLAKSKLFR